MITVLLATIAGVAAIQPAAHVQTGAVSAQVRGAALATLRVDPASRGHFGPVFAKVLEPVGWSLCADTRTTVSRGMVEVAPLDVWVDRPIAVEPGEGTVPAALTPGTVLGQTFRISDGWRFTSVEIQVPTWSTSASGATLTLRRGDVTVATRICTNVRDNGWLSIHPDQPQGGGDYTIELSNPVGQIGWWSKTKDHYDGGTATVNGSAVPTDRTIHVDAMAPAGRGSVTFRPTGSGVRMEYAVAQPLADLPPLQLVWRTSWTRAGYDCSPAAGVRFSRFFTDNQRYMPVQQLKRRSTAGLDFAGARWIEMEGTEQADLRVAGRSLGLSWDMTANEMAMRLTSAWSRSGAKRVAVVMLSALPRVDSVPATYPRFELPGRLLTDDVNRLWWERAFTYPAPAGGAAWYEWMALMRSWYAGPQRNGEMANLRSCPITDEGYVHTWGGSSIGWPFPGPPYDTRHFDTNARFILACARFYQWTGDKAFLRSQASRLRAAMRYQLEMLQGNSGLIVAASKDVTGRHQAIGNNYWDITPFGHLDAYANAVWYASLGAMKTIDRALGTNPLADYDRLRTLCHERYDELFWNGNAGRYIGCIDVDGERHDYGFTFVNLEAMFYGLGSVENARRIYRWMETGVTSSGRPDTYSKFVFAPRANTIHNPMWGPGAPESDRSSAVKPWWMFGWTGTPYGEQCQDGGAIFYTSFFDLMARQKNLGPDNAWKRFTEILARYRMPDRLCGGAPLYRGERPQQEDPGAVGLDLPFPESGLVPCYLLYGVIGVDATDAGLRIAPTLPKALPFAAVHGLSWRGASLSVRVTRTTVTVTGTARDRKPIRRMFRIRPGGSVTLRAL